MDAVDEGRIVLDLQRRHPTCSLLSRLNSKGRVNCISALLPNNEAQKQRKGKDQRMEDHRCRVAAKAVDDPRCEGYFGSTLIVDEDPRYMCADRRVDLDVEDCRCGRVAMNMEDPRCQGLLLKW